MTLLIASLALTVASKGAATQHSSGAAASARNFVQEFYDWYTPRSFQVKTGPEWAFALKERPKAFDDKLLRALKLDIAKQAKVKDEIVGLDFDPFLNSQDPPHHVIAKSVSKKGTYYLVSVYANEKGLSMTDPLVTAKLERAGKRWRFANFLYQSGHDLLGILRK